MPVPTCVLGSRGVQDHVSRGHSLNHFVELGSLSKVVTGTILTQLATAGALHLDDQLELHLADVPKDTGVTLRHLAEHTSGLPRLPPQANTSTADPYRSFTETALRDVLRNWHTTATGPVGKKEYSNLGYAILGRVLTTATDSTFQRLTDEHVLAPLDLPPGAVTATPPPERRLVAQGFLGRPRPHWTLTGPILPAGGLWATPHTAARLVVGLVVDRVLGEPAPTWDRSGPALWHIGATRTASAFAGAHEDGRWIFLHRLHGNHRRTTRLALQKLKA
ncbi:serine hydrolase domain-containing protein [Streptomyces noursei]|uniref:serine hydrolase domain-containing protein n=1 Tax=Streptomyces noursei TaxID=1971 RepID=UPI0019638C2C|nr:serine hydrolase domain-containing protein [Streptomyces noursei]QRX91152.1 beta-lactamase family protein [Streptomyces noursei]